MLPVYRKTPLTLLEQLQHPADKGLEIPDPVHAAQVLRRVGLYRFKGYLLPYKTDGGYQSDLTFGDIERLMALDETLRLQVLQAMPLVEVGIRQAISQHLLEIHGLRWYAKAELFAPPSTYFNHSELLARALSEFHGMPDLFVGHYRERYDQNEPPPIWMVAETMTLGNWSKLFEALASQADRDAIAASLNIRASTLASWLHALTVVRNVCAHHSRLYDRTFNTMGLADNRRTKRLLRQHSFDERDEGARRLAPRFYALHRLTNALDPASLWTTELKTCLAPCTPTELTRIGFRTGWNTQAEWNTFSP